MKFGDLGRLAFGGDPGAQLVAALGAAVEARSMDPMPGGGEPGHDRLPDPTALIGAVKQDKIRHSLPSLWPAAARP
ncbi:MAG: hypothetical protein ACREFA_15900 [Stellaceae bacterium]